MSKLTWDQLTIDVWTSLDLCFSSYRQWKNTFRTPEMAYKYCQIAHDLIRVPVALLPQKEVVQVVLDIVKEECIKQNPEVQPFVMAIQQWTNGEVDFKYMVNQQKLSEDLVENSYKIDYYNMYRAAKVIDAILMEITRAEDSWLSEALYQFNFVSSKEVAILIREKFPYTRIEEAYYAKAINME